MNKIDGPNLFKVVLRGAGRDAMHTRGDSRALHPKPQPPKPPALDPKRHFSEIYVAALSMILKFILQRFP